jgi:hypothetical protein
MNENASTWPHLPITVETPRCSDPDLNERENGEAFCSTCLDRWPCTGVIPYSVPEIVVLCGSTRFGDAFAKANLDLTLAGKIVLSIGCVTSTDVGLGIDEATKARLDELHKRKIDLADRVLVLNVGGYIGESTYSEIVYAIAHGKPIEYLEPRSGTFRSEARDVE